MKTLKTITGNEIKVSSNKSQRTYTLKTNGATYRTVKLTSDEFFACEYNSGNDWAQFLKTDDYYKVR